MGCLSAITLRNTALAIPIPRVYYTFNIAEQTNSGLNINCDPTSILQVPLIASQAYNGIINTAPPGPKEGTHYFSPGNKVRNAMANGTLAIPTASGFSVSLWTQILSAGSTNQIVCGVGIGTTSKWYLFYDGPKLQVLCYCNGANNILGSQSAFLTNAGWGHVVMTWTGTSIKLYLNGVLKTWTTSNPTALPNETWTSLSVGKDVSGVLGNAYTNVDCLRVYDSVLTQAQVTAIYNSGT